MVRAKFLCIDVVENLSKDGTGKVFLRPVISGSTENVDFYRLTPGGQISLETINPEALAEFEAGKEYYVDFCRADK